MQKQDDIDWKIKGTKAVMCLRRFRSTYDTKWVELAEKHLSEFNGYLKEIDGHWFSISDPCEYLRVDDL